MKKELISGAILAATIVVALFAYDAIKRYQAKKATERSIADATVAAAAVEGE